MKALLVAAALPLLVACGAGDGERTIDVVREGPGGALDPDLSTADRLGFRPRESLFLYAVPEGFEELEPKPLREVNLRFEDVDCYVSLLGGGSTLANVNRWRGQMGLPPMSQDELDALPRVEVLGRRAPLVDLEGTFHGMGGTTTENARLLGVHVSFPAFSVSVKMVGPAERVAVARPGFEAFLRSLRFNPAAAPATGGGGGEAPEGAAALGWSVPEGWRETQGSRMRLVTFEAADHPGTRCWVTRLPGSAGGVEANVNRWRRELGAEPLSDEEIAGLPRVEMLGGEAVVVEAAGAYRGMGGEAIDQARLLGAILPLPEETVFVKMVGPDGGVQAERQHFFEFCRSLRR